MEDSVWRLLIPGRKDNRTKLRAEQEIHSEVVLADLVDCKRSLVPYAGHVSRGSTNILITDPFKVSPRMRCFAGVYNYLQ